MMKKIKLLAGLVASAAFFSGTAFAAVGGRLDDRNCGTGNTNGAGGDTANNDMWRDFIFARDASAGMDITISSLFASTNYLVRL
ncbi:MAG: hypothetical protein ACI8QT_001450 [Halioglobus sp.]|jgi:hypothetical protein